MPKQAKIQNHFNLGQLGSVWHQPAQADDLYRRYFVEDSNGRVAKATSNEYNVAEALKELKIEFTFQMAIQGGKVAFGMMLDFMLHTKPLPTPVWVHGEHWHMGAARKKDLKQMQILDDYMHGQVAIPIEIWGSQSGSKEEAISALKKAGLV